jgi:hypothetical protein
VLGSSSILLITFGSSFRICDSGVLKMFGIIAPPVSAFQKIPNQRTSSSGFSNSSKK